MGSVLSVDYAELQLRVHKKITFEQNLLTLMLFSCRPRISPDFFTCQEDVEPSREIRPSPLGVGWGG